MAYVTQQDLIDRFGENELRQVADVDGSGDIDPARMANALSDADAEVEASLFGRYQLPLASVPELLTRLACDLARESLYTDAPPEVVTDRAKVARSILAKIASGAMSFGLPRTEAAASTAGLVEIVTGRRTSPFGG